MLIMVSMQHGREHYLSIEPAGVQQGLHPFGCINIKGLVYLVTPYADMPATGNLCCYKHCPSHLQSGPKAACLDRLICQAHLCSPDQLHISKRSASYRQGWSLRLRIAVIP